MNKIENKINQLNKKIKERGVVFNIYVKLLDVATKYDEDIELAQKIYDKKDELKNKYHKLRKEEMEIAEELKNKIINNAETLYTLKQLKEDFESKKTKTQIIYNAEISMESVNAGKINPKYTINPKRDYILYPEEDKMYYTKDFLIRLNDKKEVESITKIIR